MKTAFAVFVMAVFALFGAVSAVEISAVPYTINQSGFYNLSSDMTCPDEGSCIAIEASNVVLDCMGKTLSDAITGVYVPGPLSNITVKNCNFDNFEQYGVYIEYINEQEPPSMPDAPGSGAPQTVGPAVDYNDYMTIHNCDFTSESWIQAAVRAEELNNSRITNNSMSAEYVSWSGILYVESMDRSVVSGNDISSGYMYGASGIYVYSASNSLLQLNNIHDNEGYGIIMYPGGLSANAEPAVPLSTQKNVTIDRNNISNSYIYGIYASNLNDSFVTNNILLDIGSHGIYLPSFNHGVASNNSVRNATIGMYLTECTGVAADYNYMALNSGSGMHLSNVVNGTFNWNNMSNNSGDGIYASDVRNSTFNRNNISSSDNGIYALGSESNTFTWNDVHHNLGEEAGEGLDRQGDGYGIYFATDQPEAVEINAGNGYNDYNVLEENAVHDNVYGIGLGDGGGNLISDNRIYDNERTGIEVRDDAADNEISWNEIYGSSDYLPASGVDNGQEPYQTYGIMIEEYYELQNAFEPETSVANRVLENNIYSNIYGLYVIAYDPSAGIISVIENNTFSENYRDVELYMYSYIYGFGAETDGQAAELAIGKNTYTSTDASVSSNTVGLVVDSVLEGEVGGAPEGYTAVGKYLLAYESELLGQEASDQVIDINTMLYYTTREVARFNESSLVIAQYVEEAQGAVPTVAGWIILNTTLDTAHNTANATSTGGVLGLFGVYEGGGSSGGETKLQSMALSKSTSCPDNRLTATATSDGSALEGAYVKLVKDGAIVDGALSGSDGKAYFTLSESGSYSMEAEKTGYYNPAPVAFAYELCAEPEQAGQNQTQNESQGGNQTHEQGGSGSGAGCVSNDGCAQNQYCNQSGACVNLSGACGYASNHQWVGYECCDDSACANSGKCENNKCVAPPVDDGCNDSLKALQDAQAAINSAKANGKNTSEAEAKYNQAKASTDCLEAKGLAEQAKLLAENAPALAAPPANNDNGSAGSHQQGFDWLMLLIVLVIIVVLGAGAYVVFGRKR